MSNDTIKMENLIKKMHKKRNSPNAEYDSYLRYGSGYHWQWLKESKNRRYLAYSYYDYLKFILKRITKNIKKTKSRTILDAGCGDAILLYLINKNVSNLELSGFDFIESAIKFGRSKLTNANLFVLDIRNIFSYYKHYDYIICTEVIDHVLPPHSIKTSKRIREFQKKILNKLISLADKGVFLTIPTRGVWRDFDKKKEKIEEDGILLEWILTFNLKFRFNLLKPVLNYFEKMLRKIFKRPEKLISIANNLKNYISFSPKEDWSCFDENKLYKKEETLLIEWLEDLGLNYNWDFLKHDKKNTKGTYFIEFEK